MKESNYFNLAEFANPNALQGPVSIDKIQPSLLQKFLRSMLLVRKVEQCLADGKRDGLIGGPVHLGVGQEAVAVGVSESIRSTDRVFGAHRSHSHLLALSQDPYLLFAEVLGKVTGHSRGMGGSMHLWAQSSGFYGSVPIVAGTVSLAVGTGLASKLQDLDDVAVAYLGDGAMEEGIVHESLNLARVQKVPIIFVVENNLFASHMHISKRQPRDSTSRFAWANDIPYHLVDGNDIVQVTDAAEDLVNSARTGDGPGFLEAVTYRWYGHVDWREDIDVGVNRSKEDLEKWRLRDPIRRLKDTMQQAGIWSLGQHQELNQKLDDEIQTAWQQALKAPYPEKEALLNGVFAVS